MIRVVIVDDHQESVNELIEVLEKYGIEAEGVTNAHDALDVCKDFQPHLIIYDGLMDSKKAWMFGFELLNYIYEQDSNVLEESIHPYMVALTGFGSVLQRTLCEECGYDEYVTKPIALSVLLGWVKKAKVRYHGREWT
jgi:CheY-like chemotaxis protein